MNWFAYFFFTWVVASLAGLIYLLVVVVKTKSTKLDSVPLRTKKIIGLITYSLGPVGLVDIALARMPFEVSPSLVAYTVMTGIFAAILFKNPVRI